SVYRRANSRSWSGACVMGLPSVARRLRRPRLLFVGKSRQPCRARCCSVAFKDLRQPLQRDLVALVCSAAVVTGVLAMFVRDTGSVQIVTEEPVAPVQVVVVVRARIEQDAGQLSEVVEAVVHVDDRVESQPPVPDLLDQLAA